DKPLIIKSTSTLISTNIDTNDDGFPSILATGIAVNPKLGRILFSNQNETAPTGNSCETSFGEDGNAFSLVQGTLVLNVSRNNNEAEQIIINLTKLDICFSTESNRFSAVQEGDIIEGTGKYENATGSITGDFLGTFRAIDTTEGKFIESYSNVMGLSELNLSY
ncbi:MAG: hypothetical protein R3321_15170, partial [Nitrososphaeraceae archaeon]|nr:hypothetical protein [Nitrososphaeraceae archaeon]